MSDSRHEGKRGFNDNNVMSLGASYCFRTHLRVGGGGGGWGEGGFYPVVCSHCVLHAKMLSTCTTL